MCGATPQGGDLAGRPTVSIASSTIEEHDKPAISFGDQEEPDFSCIYGGTGGEGEPLYGTALVASVPAEFERKPHVNANVITSLPG